MMSTAAVKIPYEMTGIEQYEEFHNTLRYPGPGHRRRYYRRAGG